MLLRPGGHPAREPCHSTAGSWRRRTGIEPADDAKRRPPVLKTGGATRHPDASGADVTRAWPAPAKFLSPEASREDAKRVAYVAEEGPEWLCDDLEVRRPSPVPAYRQ